MSELPDKCPVCGCAELRAWKGARSERWFSCLYSFLPDGTLNQRCSNAHGLAIERGRLLREAVEEMETIRERVASLADANWSGIGESMRTTREAIMKIEDHFGGWSPARSHPFDVLPKEDQDTLEALGQRLKDDAAKCGSQDPADQLNIEAHLGGEGKPNA